MDKNDKFEMTIGYKIRKVGKTGKWTSNRQTYASLNRLDIAVIQKMIAELGVNLADLGYVTASSVGLTLPDAPGNNDRR
jgi:hypothetical protein